MEKNGWREWGTQDLPTPVALHAALVEGKGCRVNGHKLSPDEHGVWITNPYGIDCGLWQELTVQRVEEFLIDMAQDKDYGPLP